MIFSFEVTDEEQQLAETRVKSLNDVLMASCRRTLDSLIGAARESVIAQAKVADSSALAQAAAQLGIRSLAEVERDQAAQTAEKE